MSIKCVKSNYFQAILFKLGRLLEKSVELGQQNKNTNALYNI